MKLALKKDDFPTFDVYNRTNIMFPLSSPSLIPSIPFEVTGFATEPQYKTSLKLNILKVKELMKLSI